jgi:hypothetical protein
MRPVINGTLYPDWDIKLIQAEEYGGIEYGGLPVNLVFRIALQPSEIRHCPASLSMSIATAFGEPDAGVSGRSSETCLCSLRFG